MQKTLGHAVIVILLATSFAVRAYDSKLAASYSEFFAGASGAEAGSDLHFISAEGHCHP
jgi:hypothetical protein